MAQYRWFNQVKSLQPELCRLDGYIATNGSGVVLNTASKDTAPLDVFGRPLLFPRGIVSVAKDNSVAGLYHIVLEQTYFSIESVHAELVKSTVVDGNFQVLAFNPNNGMPTDSTAARTINLQFQVSGSAAAVDGGGFFLTVILKNINI
jgi:hypothetical protein